MLLSKLIFCHRFLIYFLNQQISRIYSCSWVARRPTSENIDPDCHYQMKEVEIDWYRVDLHSHSTAIASGATLWQPLSLLQWRWPTRWWCQRWSSSIRYRFFGRCYHWTVPINQTLGTLQIKSIIISLEPA